jgi:protein tyrosine kinase modulator
MPETHFERYSGLGLDLVVDVWRRRKWIGLITAAAIIAATVSAVRALPNLYRATATVLVERQQVSETFVRPSVTAELETRIQTIHQRVMSRERLSEIITKLDLYPEAHQGAPMEALVQRLRRESQLGLKGVAEQSTGRTATIAFTLSYTGGDPEIVARVANTLASSYAGENSRTRERQASRTTEFLRAQLETAKRELDQQEQRTNGFKLQHSGELQQVEVNLTALDRLNTQLRMNQESQQRVAERRERAELEAAEAQSGVATAAQVAADPRVAQLLKLRQELNELRSRFSDQYPEVIQKRTEIASLEAEMRRSGVGADGRPVVTASAADPAKRVQRQTVADVDRELRALKDEEASLKRLVASYESRVENAPRRAQEFQQLSRDSDSIKERYQTLLKQSEEARLAENLEEGQNTEQFRLLDPAIPPTAPIAPNRTTLMLMGFAAALALGLGSMLAAEKLDTTFHSADDLRGFIDAPILATIRRIPTKRSTRRHRLRVALAIVGAIAILTMITAGSHYAASGNDQIVRLTAREGTS